MTYKDFVRWCNERACDGKWSMDMAICCIHMIDSVQKTPIWRRKKKWKTIELYALRIKELCDQHYSERSKEEI